MGLRSLLGVVRRIRSELAAVNQELTKTAQNLPLPIPGPAQPGPGGDAPRVGRGGGGANAPTGGGGSSGTAGGGSIQRSEIHSPALGTRGPRRTTEELEDSCRRSSFPLRNPRTGLDERVDVWVCPDGATYLVPEDPITISAESRGGGPTRSRANERVPVTTTGSAGGADIGSRRRGRDPSSVPGAGTLTSGPIPQGLKAIKDSVEGLRRDLRRSDSGTGARARGDL